MKVIVQRVLKANCVVDNTVVGSINRGYLLLVGFANGDTEELLDKMAKKIAGLRVFEDENGKMNLSLHDVEADILSISQFTLYADPYKGNRPSFVEALSPEFSKPLYLKFNEILRKNYGLKVEEGIFGEHMELNVVCDGPVTIEYEFR